MNQELLNQETMTQTEKRIIEEVEAGREDFDRMKESLEGLYGGRNGFKSGEIKESEGEISTEITTDDVKIELALKNGYLSANIEEI